MTSRLVLTGVPEDIADPLRRFLEQLTSIKSGEEESSLVEQKSSDVFLSLIIDLFPLEDMLRALHSESKVSDSSISEQSEFLGLESYEDVFGTIERLERENTELKVQLGDFQKSIALSSTENAIAGIMRDMSNAMKGLNGMSEGLNGISAALKLILDVVKSLNSATEAIKTAESSVDEIQSLFEQTQNALSALKSRINSP